tara:strand:- start:779 stop:1030 length:252 start_codon:yes stop_codon:yes gene_type:complete
MTPLCLIALVTAVSGYDILDEIAEGADMFNPPFPMLFQTEEEIFAQAIIALIIIVLILFFLVMFVFCFDIDKENNKVYPTKED